MNFSIDRKMRGDNIDNIIDKIIGSYYLGGAVHILDRVLMLNFIREDVIGII